MALNLVPVLQSVSHGGTNNGAFTDKTLTFYDEENDKIISAEGTEVTTDDDNNPVLHVDKLDADNLNVNTKANIEELEVNGNTVLNGDLIVKGTRTEEHTADLFVGSDTITLRDGATTALENGEVAGILINKYDGTDSLGLVTTNDGTLRVGELNLVYVYWTTDTESEKYGKYYSDDELTNEVTVPTGATIYSESTDPTTKLAKGYYKVKDETEAIATRDETVNFGTDSIPYYDKTEQTFKATSVSKDDLEALQEKVSNITGDDKILVNQHKEVTEADIDDTDIFTFENNKYIPVTALYYNNTEVAYITTDGSTFTLYDKNDTVLKTASSFTISNNVDGTSLTLNENNKFYHNNNPVAADYEEGNYVTTDNTIEGNCIAITDEVAEGDHNIPTSDALFNYLEGWSPQYTGSWSISNWVINWTES